MNSWFTVRDTASGEALGTVMKVTLNHSLQDMAVHMYWTQMKSCLTCLWDSEMPGVALSSIQVAAVGTHFKFVLVASL